MEMNSVPLSHLVVTLQMILPNYHPSLCLDQILMEMIPSLPSFALDNLQLILTLREVFLWIQLSVKCFKELRMFLSSRTTHHPSPDLADSLLFPPSPSPLCRGNIFGKDTKLPLAKNELVTMPGEKDEEHKEPKFPSTRTQPNQPTSLSTMATSSTANSTQATTPPPPPFCFLLHCLSCCRSVVMSLLFVMLMTSLPQIHATSSTAAPSSLKSMAAQSDHQHHDPSPSPVPTICANGLEDGNYLFRSYSEQSWSFCGVSGAGYRGLSFQISDCECHAGVDRQACADTTSFSSLSPASVPPSIPHHLSGLHCSADDYSISSTDTCLLITSMATAGPLAMVPLRLLGSVTRSLPPTVTPLPSLTTP
jgi:hypothetical protein